MRETQSPPSGRSAVALLGGDVSVYRRRIVVALILLTASLVQLPVILNADLGWLLTVNEKILEGRKLGIDLFESNPPLSVYMYMPAVMLARLTGIAAEFFIIALVILEIAGALFVIERAGVAAKLDPRERNLSTWSFAFLLAILPGTIFGQREHIAVVALTPFVAITALRWRGRDPGRAAILAGIGAGLAMSIKPFFALVAGLPIILVALRQRSVKPLFTAEAWTAAIVAIGYGAVIAIVFPAYLSIYAPMVAKAYLPIRQELAALLPVPIAVIGASLGFLRLLRPQNLKAGSNAIPWLAAAVGGGASFLLQGKGWPYTAFAACLFAIAAPLLQVRVSVLRRPVMIGGLAVIVALGFYLSSPAPGFPPLAARVQAHVQHPRLLTITDHIGLGHPLVRQIGGVWVGSSCAQLLAAGAILRENNAPPTPGELAKLDGIVNFERQHLLADLRSGRPDVILVDTYLLSTFQFDWLAWARADPELREQLSRYREVEDVGRVRIFINQSGARN